MARQHLGRELQTLGAWLRIHNASRHSAWFPRQVCLCWIAKIEAHLKLPFARYFNAFRYAPVGRRLEVVLKLWSAPLPVAIGESVDIGEFRSVEEFETKYATLATVLGHAGKTPPPGEQDFLHAMESLDDVRYPGGIGARDFFFLTALVGILAPRRVIEIGTLTGFSAAIIAAAIHRQHGNSSEVSVETIDASAQCIVDETRPIGFEIPELIPELASTVRVHTGRKSDFARELGAREEFGLAFIDADHLIPGHCSMCSGSPLMSKAQDG